MPKEKCYTYAIFMYTVTISFSNTHCILLISAETKKITSLRVSFVKIFLFQTHEKQDKLGALWRKQHTTLNSSVTRP